MSRQRKVIRRESTGRKIIEQSRIRLLCVGLFFLLCFGSISVRMIEVAVVRNPAALTVTVSDPDKEGEGDKVMMNALEPTLQRGDIVDRNGVLLATSLTTASMFANPTEVRNPEEAAQKLAKTLGLDAKVLVSRLKSDKTFVWIERNLTPREQQAANSLGIPGLYFFPEERRVYPFGSLLAHALGYVGVDNRGLSAVEKYFDERLRDEAKNREPLMLSLDVRLQTILHEELSQAVTTFNAKGGAGVIMDVRTGELLSMVSLPDFDPHKPGKAPKDARFNRVSLGSYEMGSTFKSFTMAMAMEQGVANMQSRYDATQPFKIATFTISDSHPQRRKLTVPEIYAYSSNIGTAKMALDVGGVQQQRFLRKLGMMDAVDVEIPERGGTLYPDKWKEINTVTISYGHGISVSPLHLVRGIATITGDGYLPRMTLLKNDNSEKAKKERVVSENTVKNMRRLMRLAVDYGTGGKADVPGYRVGGKTGTAEKISETGSYKADAKLTSFIGVFPVDDPQYVVLVMVDEPKGNKSTHGYATGGWIAAPVAGNVIARMGPMLGLKPAFEAPGDDAKQFWVENTKPKSRPAPVQAAVKPAYVHTASY